MKFKKRNLIYLSILLLIIVAIARSCLLHKKTDTSINTYETVKPSSTDQITVQPTAPINNNKSSQPKTLVNSDFDKVTFVKVVDGVTIIVNDGKKDIQVKLLCVNTEESDSSNTKDKNKYSEKASEFTKDYFKDIKTLYLQYDAEKVDTDGNTLAYVWLSDDLDPFNENDIISYMYNAIMLDKGMAYVTIQDPNKYYEGFFRKIEVDSFVSKDGLWKYKEYRDMLGHQ